MTRAAAGVAFLLGAGFLASAGCGVREEAPPGPAPGTTHAPREVEGEGIAPRDPDALWREFAAARDPADAIAAADALEAAGEALTPAARRRVYRAVDAVEARELGAVWEGLGAGGAAAAACALRAAKWARHRGEDEAALRWLERAEGDGAIEERAVALRAEILDAREVAPGRVALILPLSGRHAEIGREIRRGVELAAEAAGGGAEIATIDTGGDPAGAARAVDEAVGERRAALILGPVGREESGAAAARASARGAPIALLSPSAEGAPSAGVYRLWSSEAWEGRQAARLARELRYERAGILAPRDGPGAARARAFSREADRLGVEIVRRGDYDPTGTDLEPDMRAFLNLDPSENERLRRHLRRRGEGGWKTFVPDFPAELVYIPDRYDRAALAASYFPYFNVVIRTDPFMNPRDLKAVYGEVPPIVQLFGSSGWLDPGLAPRGGDDVEGARIVAPCREPARLREAGRAFYGAFEDRHGREPGEVAAQAHDAARLALRAAAAAEGAERGAVRRKAAAALEGARLRDGACGPGRVRGGALDREPAIYEVQRGEFVQIRSGL